MAVTGGKGLLVLVNAQAEALFGYARAELIGRSVGLLVPGRFAGGHPKLRAGYVADPPKVGPAKGSGVELLLVSRCAFGIPLDNTCCLHW